MIQKPGAWKRPGLLCKICWDEMGAKAVEQGKKVSADIKILYNEGNERPSGFMVIYDIDGLQDTRYMSNYSKRS